MTDPAFPIGKYEKPEHVQQEHIEHWIEELSAMPEQLAALAGGLTEQQLEAAYRENGWTARQVIHHIADAFMNAYIHFKLALTEDNPIIKPYQEELWAEQGDEKHSDIGSSLLLVQALVDRWVQLLRGMDASAFQRTFVHPANGQQSLDSYLGFCAWHGKHHLVHLQACLQ